MKKIIAISGVLVFVAALVIYKLKSAQEPNAYEYDDILYI